MTTTILFRLSIASGYKPAMKQSPSKIAISRDQTSPFEVSRKTRFEALAYRINDWVDESMVAPKLISSTPERNPRETSTPSKIRDPTILKSTSVVSSPNFFITIIQKNYFLLSTAQLQECTPVKISGSEDVSTPYKSLVLDKSVLQSLV